MEDIIGKVLEGRYRIVELLGGGGMARVYKAKDLLLDRIVTIKVLRDEYAKDAEFLAGFRREAQAVARLSHPNVVSLFDVGQEGDLHYLIMEYVEGKSLKEFLKERGPLTPQEAVKIALQICDALEHAHVNGIIHRDVKPHNILTTADGRVKVTDFGIAQAVNEGSMAQGGTLLGSVHYLAPEQAQGRSSGVAADIYSLGVVLYEMLAGFPPFQGKTPLEVAIKHIQDPPPPLKDVPPGLERVVMRALEKDPERRYPSVAALRRDLQALDRVWEDESYATRVISPINPTEAVGETGRKGKRRSPWLWLGLTLLFLALAIGGLWAGFRYYWLVGEVEVPKVIGLKEEAALRRLEEAGLRGQVGKYIYSEAPEGEVVDQTPSPREKVKRGRSVILTVSKGTRMVVVPPVIGLSEREARATLENAGFKVAADSLKAYHPTIPEGSVVEQSPPGGSRQPEGTVVRLVVSKGPKPQMVSVPKLVGLTLGQAQQQLAAARLEVGNISYKRSEEYFPDTVMEQDPPGGSSLLQGSKVNLVVSQGPGPARKEAVITVPPTPDDKPHDIRIIVEDAKGTREVFRDKQEKGKQLLARITYYGKGKLQVFRDGERIYVQDLP